ncbi:MFS transporter [Glycomyces sp. NPDC047369]
MPATLQGDKAIGRLSLRVTALCWLLVFLDGVDYFVYSAVTNLMSEDKDFGFTLADTGTLGSYATFGMLIGALVAGTLTDMIGRRKILAVGVTVFSLASAASALAPTVGVFGLTRFIAGLGLGGLLPVAIAMAMEFAPARRKNLAVTITMTAHQAGGVAAGLLGISFAMDFGWRSVFWLGALPLVAVLPLVLLMLPESPAFLLAKGRRDQAEAMLAKHGVPIAHFEEARTEAKTGVRALFARRTWGITLLFFATTFFGLMLVYGVSVWLPKLMRENGYDLGASIVFLVVINAGGIAGMLVAGRLADRFNAKLIATIWFAVTCLGLLVFSVQMPLLVTYAVVFVTGGCLFSAQTLVYASVGSYFTAGARATAIGWNAGIGRWGAVFGPTFGTLLVAGGSISLPFYGFAVAAALGALSLLAIRAKPQPLLAPVDTGAPAPAKAL